MTSPFPPSAEALLARGNSLLAERRFHEALSAYSLHLALKPQSAEAWHNRAIAFSQLGRQSEALACFDKAVALRPDAADGWANRGTVHLELGHFAEARRDYHRALEINPDYPYTRGYLVLAKLHACDWDGLEPEIERVSADIAAGKRVIVPFGHVVIAKSPEEQRVCAQTYLAGRGEAFAASPWRWEPYRHERLRIAYLSGDFRVHPVAIQIVGVFEHHDKSRFETIGVSFGADDGSALRARIVSAFDRFIDVRGRSDHDIAFLLRHMEIDIAVDLTGLTHGCRPGIFALRPAPIQVSFLGYPATLGGDWADYILADETVIPKDEKRHYSENVVYLPDSFFPADGNRPVAGWVPSRAEAGLPATGLVFAAFNNPYKFRRETFAVWLRLLKQVEGSVLWLPEQQAAAHKNLLLEAAAAGVEEARLVFAPFLPKSEDHLARLSLADLFLDTLPCNAHASANDALWAGVPVLTAKGTTFAGRVAASQLGALGLNELVTESLSEYEARALELARNSERLEALRAVLLRRRRTAPLFDTARFTRHLEAAFSAMQECALAREPPRSFAIAPFPS